MSQSNQLESFTINEVYPKTQILVNGLVKISFSLVLLIRK